MFMEIPIESNGYRVHLYSVIQLLGSEYAAYAEPYTGSFAGRC